MCAIIVDESHTVETWTGQRFVPVEINIVITTELFIFFTATERVADGRGYSLTYCTLIIFSI